MIPVFLSRVPAKVWALAAVAGLMLVLVVAVKVAVDRADRAERRAEQAQTTTKALDTVATETSGIRREQEEQQREVDKIPGADAPLPAGFGADLERVRRGERNPRQP